MQLSLPTAAIKKTLIAVLALGISLGAFANGRTVAMPSGFNVTVPHQDSGWGVGIEGIYWQTNLHNLAYAVTGRDISNDQFDNLIEAEVHSVEPDFGWGFSLWGTYFFEGQGNDITLRYTRLHHDDSDSVDKLSDEDSESVTPTKGFPEQGGDDPWDHGRSVAEFNYDAVDLLLGQHIDVGPRLDLHLAAGLRYVTLDSSVKDHFIKENVGEDLTLSREIKYASDFHGIGPRVEATAMYDFSEGLGFVVGAGGSLLIGQNNVESVDQSNCSIVGACDASGDADDFTSLDQGDTQQVVPEVDGKIGINYVYDMGGDCGVSIEAGWKAMAYFDVHKRMRPIENEPKTRDLYLIETTSNLTFHGPYVNFEFRSA